MTAIKDIDLGWNKIKKELKLINKSYTQVGMQSDAGNEDNGQSIAAVAAYNEFGTERIPARPFIRGSFDDQKRKLNNIIDKKYNEVLQQKTTVKDALGLIGLFMEAAIKMKITNSKQWAKPNAQSTIDRKTVAGKIGDTPLIDTGSMRAAIRHVEVIK